MRNEAYKNQFLRDSRVERLKRMLGGSLPAEVNELENWLCDMEDYKFKHGEMFELYNRKTDTVSQGQVETVLDEMVQFKYINVINENAGYNQNQLSWLSKDSNKLQPFNAHKSQFKIRLCEHLEQLHENRERTHAAQNNQMRETNGDQEMQGGGGRYPQGGNIQGGDHSDGDDDSEDDDNDQAYS